MNAGGRSDRMGSARLASDDGAAGASWSGRARERLSRITPWLFVALLALYLAYRDLELLPARPVLAAVVLAFLAALVLKLEDVAYGRRRGLGVLLALAGALPTLVLLTERWRHQRLLMLVPLLIGWGLYCAMPAVPRRAVRGADLRRETARWLAPLVVLAGTLGAVAFMIRNTGPGVAVFDETLYLLQSALMQEPGFTRRLDPSLARFFAVQQATITPDGRLYTQFPPGWPALLAIFDLAGLRWGAGIASGAATLAFTYLLGRELHGRFVGTVAAALLATQAYFLAMAGSYMAHAPAAACAAGAGWLLLLGERSAGRRRVTLWLAAGVLLGLAVAIRPLTGGAIALSLGTWMLLRRRLGARGAVTLAVCLTAGSAPAFAGLLHYNRATTGSALTFGYTVVHGPLHDLGFGERGMVLVDERGSPHATSRSFTPAAAVLQAAARAESLGGQLLPAFLLFPVLLAGAVYRFRYRWATIAAFLILPALYFFYWFGDWRFYVELFPFAFVGLAAVLLHVRVRDRRLANALLVFAVAGGALTAASYLQRRHAAAAPLHAYFRAVHAARREHGKVLLFVRSPLDEAMPFTWLYSLNADPGGNVVVARDLGAENVRLIARYPDHVPMRARPYAPGVALVEPLRGDGAAR